jgi:signal transduction histidine kinase
MFRSIFAPAVSFMSRLRYRQKFLLVGIVLVIPLVVLMTEFLVQTNKDVSLTARSKLAQPSVAALLDLVHSLQTYRTSRFVALSSVPAAPDVMASNAKQVADAFGTADEALRKIDLSTALEAQWEGLKNGWSTLVGTTLPGKSAADSLNTLNTYIGSLRALLNAIGNDYGSALDQEIAPHYLAQLLIDYVPSAAENLSLIQLYGVVAVNQGKLTGPEKALLPVLNGLARQNLDDARRSADYVIAARPDLQAGLRVALDDYQNSTKYFLNTATGRVIASLQADNPKVMFAADTYTAASMRALDSGYQFAALADEALRSLYAVRLDGLNSRRTLAIAAAVVAILLAAYLFNAFYLAVTRTIARLDRASQDMIRGELNEVVRLQGTDELTKVVSSFNNVAQALIITNRQLEAQKNDLEQANASAKEANRLKSEFLSTMSHELRTPLNAVIGFTGILLAGMDGVIDDAARYMIERVESNSKRLLSLINDILDISKIEAGRMELVEQPVLLRQLLDAWHRQIEVLIQQKGLNYSDDLDPDLPLRVYLDRERITQIGVNLLSNAVKFTDRGGIRLVMRKQDEWLIMQVIDSGVGIPPHAINYIFDEFRQVDGSSRRVYGGTGLGLAIVRNLCRIMGGTIAVESKLDEGSTFTVRIPLKPVADEKAEKARPVTSPVTG